jgi:outer membrane protein assembly factor BamB
MSAFHPLVVENRLLSGAHGRTRFPARHRRRPGRILLGLISIALFGIRAIAAEPISPGSSPAAEEGPIASPEPDWPQWRGPRRDGISAETGLLPTWPTGGPKLLWKVDGLGKGWSSPIIVGDRLYITGDVEDELVLYAFDRRGKLQWKAANGNSWTNSFPGARACCAYSEGRLYHLNAHGRLACLEAQSGKELWAANVLERFEGRNITWALSECLLVDGPRVLVTPGGKKALMAALDKRSGQTAWTTEPLPEERTSHCSPLLFRYAGRRLLANCSAEHAFGVDADSGKLLWSIPLRTPYGVTVTTPVFGSGKIFYVTAYTPALCYRLVPKGEGIDAQRAWSNSLDTITGGTILVGQRLFASGYRRPKWWFAFDWSSGETRAQCRDLASGAAVYADGRLYCLAEDGTAAMLVPKDREFDVAGRFRLYPRRTTDAWAHPVLLDGKLYLRYQDSLWCYDVRNR